MMRSLSNRVFRAIESTDFKAALGSYAGAVGVAVLFPVDGFSDAPKWTPGHGFAGGGSGDSPARRSWLRNNEDGTVTGVAAGITAPNGRREVWTVTATEDQWDGHWMSNGIHDIIGIEQIPGVTVHREPYRGHPAQAMEEYWDEFVETWGFIPEGQLGGKWPFAEGQYWVSLECFPRVPQLGTVWDVIDATLALTRRFGGEARVYPFDPRTGQFTNQDVMFRYTDLPGVARKIRARKSTV